MIDLSNASGLERRIVINHIIRFTDDEDKPDLEYLLNKYDKIEFTKEEQRVGNGFFYASAHVPGYILTEKKDDNKTLYCRRKK